MKLQFIYYYKNEKVKKVYKKYLNENKKYKFTNDYDKNLCFLKQIFAKRENQKIFARNNKYFM